jgi:prophage regulatory protein
MNSLLNPIPAAGFLRLRQILGDPKADPPLPPLIPVGRTSFWLGVKNGRYPAPLKLGPGTTVWRASEIRAFIERGYE